MESQVLLVARTRSLRGDGVDVRERGRGRANDGVRGASRVAHVPSSESNQSRARVHRTRPDALRADDRLVRRARSGPGYVTDDVV